MTEHDYEHVSSGIAVLAEDEPDWEDGPFTVHGVALGEGDITNGGSGKRTLWPGEVLEAAAPLLEGQPLANDIDHDVQGAPQTPVDAIIGEVTRSKYEPGVGILYEGELDDPDLARKVERDRIEVSPMLRRTIDEYDGEEADYVATGIHSFRDLATVAKGAAPSNSIQTGVAAMSAEALRSAFADDASAAGAAPEDVSSGDEPAEPGADAGTPAGDDSETPESTVGATETNTMSENDLSPEQEALLADAKAVDNPVVVAQADAEVLSEAQAYDDLHMMEADEFESLSATVEKVEGVMAEALLERTDLKESTAEALSFDALCAEFEDDEGNLDAEALVQNPETGSVDDDEEADPFADVSEEALAEARAAKERFEHWDGKNEAIAQAEQATMVEALGVESADDIDMEAL